MAKYASRRGGSKYGGSRGGRGAGKYGGGGRSGGRSARGRGGGKYDDEDDYYDEEPVYQPASRKSSHEQAGLFILGGAVLVIIITIIWLATGGSRGIYEKAGRVHERKVRMGEEDAAGALRRAENFDKANPYEEKEIVADKYQEVITQYPNSDAAKEAGRMKAKVMARRR